MIRSVRNVVPTLLGKPLTSDEAAELNRLFDALPDAISLASKLLRETHIDSAGYRAADVEVERIIARISALLND